MEKNKRDIDVKRTPPLQRSVEIPDEMWEWLKEAAEERQTSRLWCTNQFLDEIRLFLKKPMRLFWLWAYQVVPFD
jgi:hypothetical protein